jgi:Tfp pilus assembly protein PilE
MFPKIFSEKNEKFLHFLLDGICEIEIMMLMVFSASFTKNRAIEQSSNRAIEQSSNRKNVKSKKKRSFTLVEVVFTISIIGVLLAILMPAMSAIKLSAQKIQDVSHLKKVAEAWREHTINRGQILDGAGYNGNPHSINTFALQLAGYGKTNISDMVLNDASVCISSGDKYASKMGQTAFCRIDAQNQTIKPVDPYPFSNVTNFIISGKILFSYCFVLNLPGHAPLNTTPLGFTRGLNKNGLWDEKSGIYGSKGGYVVYCDGHTTWFDGSKPAIFLKWDGTGYTSDICYAVPSSAWITCTSDHYTTSADYKSENAPASIGAQGKGGS